MDNIDAGVKQYLTIDMMFGGELFIPKMSSIRIIDLVKSLDNKMKYHIVGIRPGEKIHETLCPAESSLDTIEFKDHFIIRPATDFSKNKSNNYFINKTGEKGKKVKENFIYSSDSNPDFLSSEQIKKIS